MPNLRELYLDGMSEVKELDYSFDIRRSDHCPLSSLELLHCQNMPKWQSWAGPLSNYGFPNLRWLIIVQCPNLTELSALPLSVSQFSVKDVGINSLPKMYNSSSTTTAAPSSLKSSPNIVTIANCPNLKSLDGFLYQENLDLQALYTLHINYCENLVQLPTGAFGKFESLEDLSVSGRPKLLAIDNQRNLFPAKLRTLQLGNCGEFDVQLLESAARLSTLKQLTITQSPSISRIPSSENVYTSLRVLHIYGCDKLVQYSSMQYAQGASPVNNMGASLKIDDLRISHLSLLFIEPLRSLRFVRVCIVRDCSGMESLPKQWLLQNRDTLEHLCIEEASSLRSLPGTMVRLTALRELEICKATLLEEIPELPANLSKKHIEGAGGRLLV